MRSVVVTPRGGSEREITFLAIDLSWCCGNPPAAGRDPHLSRHSSGWFVEARASFSRLGWMISSTSVRNTHKLAWHVSIPNTEALRACWTPLPRIPKPHLGWRLARRHRANKCAAAQPEGGGARSHIG